MEVPSIPFGGWAPARAAAVGRKSQKAVGWFVTRPAGTWPGQRAIWGTRRPPSRRVPFTSRRLAWLPNRALLAGPPPGPLSLAKRTSA